MPDIGKIPLADALLIEDPSDNPEDDGNTNAIIAQSNHPRVSESSVCSVSSQSSGISETSAASCSLHNRDFKIIVDLKTGSQPGQVRIRLLPNIKGN